ncbi:MAG: biotin-dependent carboxyltransferase family protein [Porticoccaceae bacterium]
MSGIKVIQPGILSLVQDQGRFGLHSIGLTTGGPMDRNAFRWANRLCNNTAGCATIEITVGGLSLESQVHSQIAVTGPNMALSINHQSMALWQSHAIAPGDRIDLGYATDGGRGYLAVTGGFQGQPCFNSQATVARESLGGLQQDGTPLQAGDMLPCSDTRQLSHLLRLPRALVPVFNEQATNLRVILGYQQDAFTPVQKQLFFSSEYSITEHSDRMGYRLQGAAIKPSIDGILSEGICLGAIQVPADGQPIVLLSDRQTIGGYPKLGSVLSLDLDKLAQLMPGSNICFEPISIEQAHNALLLDQHQFLNTQLEVIHV